SYPPPDPTVGGGAMAALSWTYPRGPVDLGDRVRALPADGSVPGMPGWRWIHTPGHTAGHVALFRDSDRTLVAGDAFVTTKQESALSALTQRREINGPPMYFTPDWDSARASVRALAALEPEVAATGHGVPMRGEELRRGLHALADRFDERAVPAHGRYVGRPAVADRGGVVSVPPRTAEETRAVALTVGGAVLAGAVLASLLRRRD
ncbi:MAG TPA: MBL fold metallo-hydrolase, partial [Longimicrobiaceae bacterium]